MHERGGVPQLDKYQKLIHFLYTFSKFKSDTPLNKMATLWEADKMQKCKMFLV